MAILIAGTSIVPAAGETPSPQSLVALKELKDDLSKAEDALGENPSEVENQLEKAKG